MPIKPRFYGRNEVITLSRNVYDDWNVDNNLTEIKSCPFCNGKGILCDDGYEQIIYGENGSYEDMDISDGSIFWCECEECGAMLRDESTPEEAIEKWNKRTSK